jgi:predicted Fe-Mo cluster-binding NifX family protein
MNVAIPLFGSRISPRFDSCQEILIATIEDARIVDQKTVSISSLNPVQRIAELCSRNVNTMICGGISGVIHNHLKNRGIRVISEVMGEAEEALNQYLAGQLQPRTFCEGRRRRACRRGGAPWQFSTSSQNGGGAEGAWEKDE